jgi:curved DNA-binding protein CbpA
MMRDFREQDFYELLDVKPHASQQELENSYQRARRFFSSDSVATYALFQPDELVLLRRRIGEAYRVLIDPERRRLYDREMLRLEGGEWSEDEAGADAEEDKHAKPHAPAVDDVQLSLKGVKEEPASAPDMTAPAPSEKQAVIKDQSEEEQSIPDVRKTEAPEDSGRDVFRKLSQEAREADSETKPAEQQIGQPTSEKEPQTEQKELPGLPPIDQETEYAGDFLRRVREARGITLNEIADTSKISIYYLRKIESEDYKELPAKVYIRGYLKQIAALLGIDPQAVCESYLKRMDSIDGQES